MPAPHSLALELHRVRSRLLMVEPNNFVVCFNHQTQNQKLKHPFWVFEFLVGAAGFEPTLAESESDVLPLKYAPRRVSLYIDYSTFQSNIFKSPKLLCVASGINFISDSFAQVFASSYGTVLSRPPTK